MKSHQRTSAAAALIAIVALANPATVEAEASHEPALAQEARDSGDIALRMSSEGGFAPVHALLLRVPRFTLYTDGLAIFLPSPGPDDDPAEVLLQEAWLDPQQYDDLMRLALDDAGLRDARASYSISNIADASTTVFSVARDGGTKEVSVYALGIDDAAGRDREAYRRFEELAVTLSNLDAWLPQDVHVVPHEPLSYLGLFAEEDPHRPDLAMWPWSDLTEADLEPLAEAPFFSTAVLTSDQVEQVTSVPSSGAFDIPVLAPSGTAYRLMIKPLLPDETTETETAAID